MTTPANPVFQATALSKYIAWFKAHERLAILVVVGLFGVHFIGKGYDYLIKHDQVQAQIATQQAQTAATKVATDDTTSKLLLTQLATLQQQVQLQSQRIDQAMQQRQQQTIIQKKTDDSSAPAELAARIHNLLGVGTIKVDTTTTPSGQLIYSLDAAHADADNLEDLQQSKLDVKDLNTKLVACSEVTAKQADTITGLKNQVGDGTLALIAEQHSHAEDVKTLKAEKKKSWLNGFKWGAITVGAAVLGIKVAAH